MLVEDNRRWLRRWVYGPTSDLADNRSDSLVRSLQVGSVALAVNRHNMPRGRSLALKLSEYVTGEGEIENLLSLNTKRPDDDRWLIFIGTMLIASRTADSCQDITIRRKVSGSKARFREDVTTG